MAQDQKDVTIKAEKRKYSRRDFLTVGGAALAGSALAVCSPKKAEAIEGEQYPLSSRYLVYDSKNCAGCHRCMIACSMVHEGEVNFSLSRIQIHRAVLNNYPFDIQINVCRQCPDPLCVKSCPTGACHISAENGNIRMINADDCIGCKACMEACPLIPRRTIWNHNTYKATKCDLCTDTPYNIKKGGINGSQACVEACPANALKVVTATPDQTDIRGYDRDLQPPRKPKPAFPKSKPKSEI